MVERGKPAITSHFRASAWLSSFSDTPSSSLPPNPPGATDSAMPAVRSASRATASSSAIDGLPGNVQTRTPVPALASPGVRVPVANRTPAKANELSRVFMILLPEKGWPPRLDGCAAVGVAKVSRQPDEHQPWLSANTYSVPPRGTFSAAFAIGPPQIGFAPP